MAARARRPAGPQGGLECAPRSPQHSRSLSGAASPPAQGGPPAKVPDERPHPRRQGRRPGRHAGDRRQGRVAGGGGPRTAGPRRPARRRERGLAGLRAQQAPHDRGRRACARSPTTSRRRWPRTSCSRRSIALNANPEVHGILVQLPLPSHIDAEKVVERIDPAKDVDGFHPYNIGRLVLKAPTLRPCTPYGCMRLLAETGEIAGRQARGRHRAVEHRRPADGARAPDGALHRDDLPFRHARPAGARPAGRHRRGRRRQGEVRAGRLDHATARS